MRHSGWSHLCWEDCWPCSVFACYTLAFALHLREEARKKTSVRVVEKCQFGPIHCVDMDTFFTGNHDKSVDPALRWTLYETGPTLGQRRYRTGCLTKGFPTCNFESNLSVRDLMWLAEIETPKSSWICLLRVCPSALVAMRKHFDWSTCTFLIWVRAADLWMGWMSCLYSRTPFMILRPLLLSGRSPSVFG